MKELAQIPGSGAESAAGERNPAMEQFPEEAG